MSKTCIYCHIVFATKNRYPAISMFHRKELYNYIYSILENYKCGVIRIGGVQDHLHILINLNPTVALSDLVKAIKQSTSIWMKNHPSFPKFEKWQAGYFAGSVGPDGVNRCKNYIDNQEQHHLGNGFLAEIEWMVTKYEMKWYKDEWE